MVANSKVAKPRTGKEASGRPVDDPRAAARCCEDARRRRPAPAVLLRVVLDPRHRVDGRYHGSCPVRSVDQVGLGQHVGRQERLLAVSTIISAR
jgi:hypothetical protein